MSEKKETTFLGHLDELRKHLIRSVIAIFLFTIIAFLNMDFIFHDILLAPSRTDFWTYGVLCKIGICIDKIDFSLMSRTMTGQFSMHLTASFIAGFILGFPYFFWEIWQFVKPALSATERKYSSGAVFFVTLLFTMGVLFGYYIVSPMTINFLANYKLDESIVNQFDITSYISTVCFMVLGCGLMFQLPVFIYVLSKIGLVTPAFLRRYRRHSIVIILFVAALLTPSPDILSQLLVGIPLLLLFELSIYVSAIVQKNKEKELKTDK